MKRRYEYQMGDLVTMTGWGPYTGGQQGKKARVTQCRGDPSSPLPEHIRIEFLDDRWETYVYPIKVQLWKSAPKYQRDPVGRVVLADGLTRMNKSSGARFEHESS